VFGGGARLGERGWGADREAARRALLDERQERRKEDRAGGRAWEACKRARQESVHLLSSPSGFQPMPRVGLATQPKRKLRGGGRLTGYQARP